VNKEVDTERAKRNKKNRRRGKHGEHELAKELDGIVVPFSGGGDIKGDIHFKRYDIFWCAQAKTTSEDDALWKAFNTTFKNTDYVVVTYTKGKFPRLVYMWLESFCDPPLVGFTAEATDLFCTVVGWFEKAYDDAWQSSRLYGNVFRPIFFRRYARHNGKTIVAVLPEDLKAYSGKEL